jgi:hypothetical protein
MKWWFLNTSDQFVRQHSDHLKMGSSSFEEPLQDENFQTLITSLFPLRVSEDAKEQYRWLEFIAMTDQAFCCVDVLQKVWKC